METQQERERLERVRLEQEKRGRDGEQRAALAVAHACGALSTELFERAQAELDAKGGGTPSEGDAAP